MSSKKLSIFERGLRYGLAVTVGFTADVIIFLLLSRAGVPILPANAAGFLVGFSLNIFMIRLLAFPGTPLPGHIDYMITLGVNLVVMVFGSIIIWTITTHFGLSLLAAKLFANAFTLLVNFAIRSLLDWYWTCSLTSRKKR